MTKTIVRALITLVMLIALLFKVHSLWESHVEDTGIAEISKANKLLEAGDTASLGQAVDSYKKAIATFQGMHNPLEQRNEGIARCNLARAYAAQKQYPQAIEAGQLGLPLLSGANSKLDQADLYTQLGLYYLKTNQLDKAADAYGHAEPLYRELGNTEKVKSVVNVEAAMAFDRAIENARRKDWPGARDAFIEAQKRYSEASNRTDEANAFHRLGLGYTVMGDSAKAADAEKQSKTLQAELPSH